MFKVVRLDPADTFNPATEHAANIIEDLLQGNISLLLNYFRFKAQPYEYAQQINGFREATELLCPLIGVYVSSCDEPLQEVERGVLASLPQGVPAQLRNRWCKFVKSAVEVVGVLNDGNVEGVHREGLLR